jgi:hypothetical protein
VYDRAFRADWSHTKVDRVVKEEAEREQVMLLLQSEYKRIVGAFKYYAILGSHNSVGCFSMKMLSFSEWCTDCKMVDRNTLKLSDVDRVFIATNIEASKLRARAGPGGKGGAVAKGILEGANAEDAVERFEFLEAMVRLAIVKYVNSKQCTTALASLQRLLLEHVIPFSQHVDPQLFREQFLYTEFTERVFVLHEAELRHAFGRFCSTHIHGVAIMELPEFHSMLKAASFCDRDFTLEEATFCYALSTMLVVDELKTRRYKTLRFVDFLEALARVVPMKTMPDSELDPEDDRRPFSVKLDVCVAALLAGLAGAQGARRGGGTAHSSGGSSGRPGSRAPAAHPPGRKASVHLGVEPHGRKASLLQAASEGGARRGSVPGGGAAAGGRRGSNLGAQVEVGPHAPQPRWSNCRQPSKEEQAVSEMALAQQRREIEQAEEKARAKEEAERVGQWRMKRRSSQMLSLPPAMVAQAVRHAEKLADQAEIQRDISYQDLLSPESLGRQLHADDHVVTVRGPAGPKRVSPTASSVKAPWVIAAQMRAAVKEADYGPATTRAAAAKASPEITDAQRRAVSMELMCNFEPSRFAMPGSNTGARSEHKETRVRRRRSANATALADGMAAEAAEEAAAEATSEEVSVDLRTRRAKRRLSYEGSAARAAGGSLQSAAVAAQADAERESEDDDSEDEEGVEPFDEDTIAGVDDDSGRQRQQQQAMRWLKQQRGGASEPTREEAALRQLTTASAELEQDVVASAAAETAPAAAASRVSQGARSRKALALFSSPRETENNGDAAAGW